MQFTKYALIPKPLDLLDYKMVNLDLLLFQQYYSGVVAVISELISGTLIVLFTRLEWEYTPYLLMDLSLSLDSKLLVWDLVGRKIDNMELENGGVLH